MLRSQKNQFIVGEKQAFVYVLCRCEPHVLERNKKKKRVNFSRLSKKLYYEAYFNSNLTNMKKRGRALII